MISLDSKKLPLDFILCHGYELTEMGEIEPILIDRLYYTQTLFKNGFAKYVIVAGKHGKRDLLFYERTKITESAVMKEYLCEKRGISKERIFEENQGTNTFDSTKNALENIILPQSWSSGIIVSNVEHLPRLIQQSIKIFPPQLIVFYSGPSITDQQERERFFRHEAEAIRYTLSRKD